MEEIRKRVDDSRHEGMEGHPEHVRKSDFKHISQIDQQEGNLQHGRLGGNFDEVPDHNKPQNNEPGK